MSDSPAVRTTIEESLKQIEHRLTHRCTTSEHDAALESLAALRESIAEMEREPSRIKLATMEKQRDEAEDRESMALEALATARLRANTSTKELDKHRQEVADQREQLSAGGRMIDELTAERDAAVQDRKHTQDWYGSRWQRMHVWFRSPEMKGTKAAHDWFSIVANGGLLEGEPPVCFMAEVNTTRFALQQARAQIAALEAAAKERDARVEVLEAAVRAAIPSSMRCSSWECDRNGHRDCAWGLLRAALSPTSTPSTKPAEAAPWRVGSKVPVNLYRGDQIMGQCQTPEIAAEIVAAMNAGRLSGEERAEMASEIESLREAVGARVQRIELEVGPEAAKAWSRPDPNVTLAYTYAFFGPLCQRLDALYARLAPSPPAKELQ